MHRRRLVILSIPALAACAALAGGRLHAQPQSFDVLILDGQVLDGTGAPARAADIGIRDGRIAALGELNGATAATVVQAAGRFVTPGFIDVHSHAGEGLAEALNHAQPLLAQGITTAMVNPDGGGAVDIAAQKTTYETRGIGVNVAQFVPHGSIRREVLGMQDRAPTGLELQRMVDLVRAGMKAGAVGLSSGPYYAPGSYATTAELVAMARPAAEAGGVYSSHIRDESDYTVGLLAAVDEVIAVAEQAKLRGIVTHMKALGVGTWGKATQALERIEAARARGVQVFADQYPYEASGTSITGALVPRWAQVFGPDALLRRAKGDERGKLVAEIRTNIARRGGAHTLVIARFEPDPSLEGKNLDELARAGGTSPEEVAVDLLLRGGASLVSFNMAEPDIAAIMVKPWTMTSSDGDLVPIGEGKPHPRAYGTFPRKLRIYVREQKLIDWPFAIRSMTRLSAEVFGLTGRGVLREGAWADVVVFDPETVRDLATYADPHQLSAGIDTVIVNGRVARLNGVFSKELAGRVLRHERR